MRRALEVDPHVALARRALVVGEPAMQEVTEGRAEMLVHAGLREALEGEVAQEPPVLPVGADGGERQALLVGLDPGQVVARVAVDAGGGSGMEDVGHRRSFVGGAVRNRLLRNGRYIQSSARARRQGEGSRPTLGEEEPMSLIRTIALACALAAPAAAQDVTLRLAHVAPPQTTYQSAAERFAANLAEASGGSMAVDIVPGGTLGDLSQLWVQTRTGALDLHLIDIGAMIAMQEARSFLVLWTPFLFEDQDQFHRYMESETFDRMMGEVEEATGVVYLGLAGDRPPRALTTAATPVRTPEDLAGLKIRTPEHPMIIDAFTRWGAAPTPIKASELFNALRTGLVDGQDNGVLDFVGAGYADAQGFYMPLDYIHSGVGIWMSPQAWERMSDEQRGWLRDAAAKAGADGRALHAEEMAAAMAALPGMGIEVVEPDRAAFEPVREAIVDGMEGGAWPEGLAAEIEGL